MMYMMYSKGMIRKQLYIEEQQERALKTKAKALGISEAELMRQALSDALKETAYTRAAKTNLLEMLFKEADKISQTHQFEEAEHFDRQALYENDNRQNRW